MRASTRGAATSIAMMLATATWGVAATASPSARLTYARGAGAESCPDEGALRSAVAARLGYDPFFPAANKSVVAEVSRVEKGFRGRVVILDEHGVSRGERVFPPSGEDCAETVRAMALAISIAIDDLSAEAPPPEPPASASPPPPPPPSPSTPTSTWTPTPPDASGGPLAPPSAAAATPIELLLFVGPHVEMGLAPSVAVGGRLGGEIVISRFSFGLEGRLDGPASDAIPGGGRVSTQIAGGDALACVRAAVPFACATVGLASFSGSGEAVAQPRTSTALLSYGGVRAGAAFPLGESFVVRGFGGLEIPFSRHEVQVDGITRFRLPIVAGQIGADVALRFR